MALAIEKEENPSIFTVDESLDGHPPSNIMHRGGRTCATDQASTQVASSCRDKPSAPEVISMAQ